MIFAPKSEHQDLYDSDDRSTGSYRNTERMRCKTMKYLQPQITNILKADTSIRGLRKVGIFSDSSGEDKTPNPSAYSADE